MRHITVCCQAKTEKLMDTPFQFAKYVTGKYFAGRRQDCVTMSNLLSQGENIALWSPLKSGKMSAVQQTFLNMRTSGKQFIICDMDMTAIHDAGLFIRRYAGALLSSVASTKDEFEEMSSRLLAGTSLVFDPVRYSDSGHVFPDSGEAGPAEINAVAHLPFALSAERDTPMVVLLREFQNIDSDMGEKFFKALESEIGAARAVGKPSCSFIFMGSRVNAMESIFQRRRFFWHLAERYTLSEISDAEISDHVMKGFVAGGKVLDRDLLQGVIRMFRNNIWYINHFFFICDSLSKGYISELTLNDALAGMISVHEPRFVSIMDDLTGFQERLLKAVLDGNVKFSTTEVIDKYRLNSSANVKRLKDALMKKEVIMFNDKDEPVIQDPLFEYWLRKFYFGEEK